MKVCIFGAGAIGTHIGAHLAAGGNVEVSVVARGETLAAVRKRGLIVETPAGIVSGPVRASADPAELGQQDYVFLTLKAQQLPEALPHLAPLIGPHTVILPPTTALPAYFFQALTGQVSAAADPGGAVARAIPLEQTLGIAYWIGAHTVAPGRAAQDGAAAGCPIGEIDGSESPRVTALAKLLTEVGIPSRVNRNILGAIWVKFVNSLCWNPVALLTLATVGGIAESDAGKVVLRMMEEADGAAATLGLAVPQPPEKRIALTASVGTHRMSMLQDLDRGRSLELEPLAASIDEMARLSGNPMPVTQAVLALARLRARAVRP